MIKDRLHNIRQVIPKNVTLVAVSKTHPVEKIQEAYAAGQRIFGENRVQELIQKQPHLPSDIEWHLIGHLQSNKVKHIAPFISLIHSVDSFKLLEEINRQAEKNDRKINCLLQIHIAKEETKFGLSFEEAENLLFSDKLSSLKNICIKGLMGMATLSNDEKTIRLEFASLQHFYKTVKEKINHSEFSILSMGMSSDYTIAIEEGSNMIRVGSSIFGNRG